MRRRRLPPGTPTSAAFIATDRYPDGYYVTSKAAGGDFIRAGTEMREPWASAEVGPRKLVERSVKAMMLASDIAAHNGGVGESHFVAGFRRGKMTAVAAPIASQRMPKGGAK